MNKENLEKKLIRKSRLGVKSRDEQMEMIYQERERAVRKQIYYYEYDKINNEPFKNLEAWVPKDYLEGIGDYIAKKGVNKWKYLMVTINFKDYDLEDIGLVKTLIKKINKVTKKKWIDQAMWCYETRDLMKGLHVHMKIWVNKKKKIYECKREIFNTVKDHVGSKRHVNHRYSNIDGCFENYIRGIKAKEIKPNNDNDIIFRRKYELQDVYTI